MSPAYRGLRVVDLLRPSRFWGQAILRRDAHVAKVRKVPNPGVDSVLGTTDEPASVKEDQRRLLEAGIAGCVDVAPEFTPAAGAENDVSLDAHASGSGRHSLAPVVRIYAVQSYYLQAFSENVILLF